MLESTTPAIGALLAGPLIVGSFLLAALFLDFVAIAFARVARAALNPRWCARLLSIPALVIHESTHAIVAMLFLHRIERAGLNPSAVPGPTGFVHTSFQTKSLIGRLGVLPSAIAPSAVPLAIAVAISPSGLKPHWAAAEIAQAFPLAPVLVIPLLLSSRLSPVDWLSALKGAGVWIPALLVASAASYVGWLSASDVARALLDGVLLATALSVPASILLMCVACLRWLAITFSAGERPPR